MTSNKTTDMDDSGNLSTLRASLGSLGGETRLSRISYNTKYAIALNQIDRIDIRETFDHSDDGVTMYVLDVYVLCVQTGIPTTSRVSQRQRPHKWYQPRRRSVADNQQQPADDANHDDAGNDDDDDNDQAYAKDPLLRKREREKQPHYRVAYRFSEFYQLRQELRAIIDAPDDSLHAKWCAYCSRLNWLVNEAPFPSRWPLPLDAIVTNVAWLKRWRTRRRQRKLARFLREIVRGARSMQYRFSGDQCDGFLNTAFVLKEFLSEPQMRQSCTGW